MGCKSRSLVAITQNGRPRAWGWQHGRDGMAHDGREWAKANRSILVVLGLGVIVYWPTRKSPSLDLADTKAGIWHCLDCKPPTVWDTLAFGEHLQSHTGRKKPYPVMVALPDGSLHQWPIDLKERS